MSVVGIGIGTVVVIGVGCGKDSFDYFGERIVGPGGGCGSGTEMIDVFVRMRQKRIVEFVDSEEERD